MRSDDMKKRRKDKNSCLAPMIECREIASLCFLPSLSFATRLFFEANILKVLG
jgi:hypothetical protein